MRAFEAVAAGALLFQEAAIARRRSTCATARNASTTATTTWRRWLERYWATKANGGGLPATRAAAGRVHLRASLAAASGPACAPLAGGTEQARRRRRGGAAEPRHAHLGSGDLLDRDGFRPGRELAEAVKEQPRHAGLANALGIVRSTGVQEVADLGAAARAFRTPGPTTRPRWSPGSTSPRPWRLWDSGPRHRAGPAHARRARRRRRHWRAGADAVHYPCRYDLFRVEWERAAWANASSERTGNLGQDGAAALAAAALLAELTDDFFCRNGHNPGVSREGEAPAQREKPGSAGASPSRETPEHDRFCRATDDLVHAFAACLLRPDLPATQAVLGMLLARKGRSAKRCRTAPGAGRQPVRPRRRPSLHDVLGAAWPGASRSWPSSSVNWPRRRPAWCRSNPGLRRHRPCPQRSAGCAGVAYSWQARQERCTRSRW